MACNRCRFETRIQFWSKDVTHLPSSCLVHIPHNRYGYGNYIWKTYYKDWLSLLRRRVRIDVYSPEHQRYPLMLTTNIGGLIILIKMDSTKYCEAGEIIFHKYLERTDHDTEEVAALKTIKELEKDLQYWRSVK